MKWCRSVCPVGLPHHACYPLVSSLWARGVNRIEPSPKFNVDVWTSNWKDNNQLHLKVLVSVKRDSEVWRNGYPIHIFRFEPEFGIDSQLCETLRVPNLKDNSRTGRCHRADAAIWLLHNPFCKFESWGKRMRPSTDYILCRTYFCFQWTCIQESIVVVV